MIVLNQSLRPEKLLRIKLDQNQEMARYKLFGGIIHIGNANGGHYFYISNINGNWHEIDDAKVTRIEESEAIKQLETNGVLMMYKKERNLPKENEVSKINGHVWEKANTEKKPNQNHQNNQNNNNRDEQQTPKRQIPSFFRLLRRRKFYRKKTTQQTKIYLEKGRKYYFDADKNCFYTVRV